jgi:rhodanese-related sulfurtransferase
VAKLGEQGTEVGYIEGGFLAWETEGFPIERS